LRVSVLINNFNYAAYIGTAIKSVLNQDDKWVECVVVDDGSTDNSQTIIEGFEGIKALFKPNGGQASAIAAGLPLCEGEIVILLDADDRLYPEACRIIAEAWRAGTTLVQYRLDMLDLQGRKIGAYPLQPFLQEGQKEYVLRWGEFPSSPTSGNAFESSFLRGAVARIEDRSFAFADGYFIFSAPLHGRVQVIDRALGAYLVHGRNASTSALQTMERIRDQVCVNIQQKTALCTEINRLGLGSPNVKAFLGPYHWRAIAFILRVYPINPEVFKGYTIIECCRCGVIKFACFPNIPMLARFRNIIALLLLFAIPRRVLRAKMPAGRPPEDSGVPNAS
jgi:glycosyltransferase involved in cell wall biosynthesis